MLLCITAYEYLDEYLDDYLDEYLDEASQTHITLLTAVSVPVGYHTYSISSCGSLTPFPSLDGHRMGNGSEPRNPLLIGGRPKFQNSGFLSRIVLLGKNYGNLDSPSLSNPASPLPLLKD